MFTGIIILGVIVLFCLWTARWLNRMSDRLDARRFVMELKANDRLVELLHKEEERERGDGGGSIHNR